MYFDDINLGEFLDYWISVVSPNIEFTTEYNYLNIINKHIKPCIGSLKVQNIKPFHIHKYYSIKLSEGLSGNTVRKHHNLLNTALKLAVFEGLLEFNPLERVIPPRKTSTAICYYDVDKLKKLLSCADNSSIKLVVYLGAYLGLRRGEICGLTWNDINFENHTVEINKSMVSGGRNTKIKSPKNKTSCRLLYIPDFLEKSFLFELRRQEKYKNICPITIKIILSL